MRKTTTAALLAAGITLAPALQAVHAQTVAVATTPTTTVAAAETAGAAAAETEDDDDSSNAGLWGLLGLLGLAGLAGLKRRDARPVTAAPYDTTGYPTTGSTGTTRP